VAEAVGLYNAWIAGEVLARELHRVADGSGDGFAPITVDGTAVRVRIERV
jgi:hypothetical protein